MNDSKLIDHLFRHQYGKMIAILTRIFGLNKLETVEDAVQDTFIAAMQQWRVKFPENPEAWLTQAAKNRAIDLFRKIKAENLRTDKIGADLSSEAIDNLFLEHEIADSQLRMIFTACHPQLNPKEQIAFALKAIAGFSNREIAAALLLKPETIKKRLTRAKKSIASNNIVFKIPSKNELNARLERVHQVLYLIFNEGFHSNHQKLLVRKDLCGEALRLTKILLSKKELRTGTGYALFALMCFHASRLESKVNENFESIDLRNQDRTKWFLPLIELGNNAIIKSMEFKDSSVYHLEASIALEHLRAKTFETTNWGKILQIYQQLYSLQPDALIALNISFINIQLNNSNAAIEQLNGITPEDLEQRVYLYYGVKAEYFKSIGELEKAKEALEEAIKKVTNEIERDYLVKKLKDLSLR